MKKYCFVVYNNSEDGCKTSSMQYVKIYINFIFLGVSTKLMMEEKRFFFNSSCNFFVQAAANSTNNKQLANTYRNMLSKDSKDSKLAC